MTALGPIGDAIRPMGGLYGPLPSDPTFLPRVECNSTNGEGARNA